VKKGTMKAHRVAGYLWKVGPEEVDRMEKDGELINMMKTGKA
jgi:hypothetical protein